MKKILLIILAVFLVIFSVSFIVNKFISKFPSPPVNFLIFGLDPRNDQLEQTETTDTIIYTHLSLIDFHVRLFSLPRDLWYYPDSVKINQIYPDSLKSGDSFDYLRSRFQNLTGQPIDKIIVITTADLKNLLSLVGGVDLYLESGFTDSEYPNPDYIKNPTSPIPIYKTVSFPSGWNHLTADNITEFVRSRKSADTAALGGTDLGRIRRQQQLIDALLQKILSQKYHPLFLRKLFIYFRSNIKSDISRPDLLSLGLKALPRLNNFKLEKIELPTGEDPKTDLIYHPKSFINRQWVFITATPDYQSLHDFIKKSLLY